MGRLVVILFLLLSVTPGARAEELADSLAAADAAFKAGRYSEATQVYLDTIQTGSTDADTYYNLSLSLYNSGELGAALAALLQAKSMRPGDADFEKNLKILSEKTREPALFEIRRSGLERWLGLAWMSARTLLWLATGLIAGGIIVLIHQVWWRQRVSSFGYKVGGVLSCIGLAWVFGLYYHLDHKRDLGAIVFEQVEVLASPSQVEKVKLFDLHAGAPFVVLSQSGDWFKIRLADSRSGWLPRESLAIFGEKFFSYQSSRNVVKEQAL